MKDPGKREDGEEKAVTEGSDASGQAEQRLMGLADGLYCQFQEGIVPYISLPSRTKATTFFLVIASIILILSSSMTPP